MSGSDAAAARPQVAESIPGNTGPNALASERSLVGMLVDGYRFAMACGRMSERLDAGEVRKFASSLRFFFNQLNVRAADAGLKLVDLVGHPFDPGMAATPLNGADFDAYDRLIVDQMLEPTILREDGSIVHTGTVLLRKVGS